MYIHDQATYPINVSATTKTKIQSKIEGQSIKLIHYVAVGYLLFLSTVNISEETLFDDAQSQAYDLMERDCFPRFRKSPYFYKLQEGIDENLISNMVKKKTGLLKLFH